MTEQDGGQGAERDRVASRTRRRELVLVLALSAVLLLGCVLKWLRTQRAGREADVVQAARAEPFRVDINAATASELQLLPGIGPQTAERIISRREGNGPFRRAQDLAEVRGISAKTAEGLAEMVVCSPPRER